MNLPDWLKLSKRDEKQRAAEGLIPKRDGWYKTVGGKTRYVCKPLPLADAVAILDRKRDHWLAGRKAPRVTIGNLTVEQLVERFLASMYDRHTTGHPKPLKRRTYDDYVATLLRFADAVGGERIAADLGPDDLGIFAHTFAGKAASTRRREIIYVDRLLNWAGPGKRSMNLIPAVNRGPDWVKPSDEDMRQAAADADKSYSAVQLWMTLDAVAPHPFLSAAFHLGLNCAFGRRDIGELPDSAVDLDGALITFPRGKTGVARLCPLVPQTVAALRRWLEYRDKLKRTRPQSEGLFFRTRTGMPYARKFYRDGDPKLSAYESNLLTVQWRQHVGLPFGGLRSTFATVADDFADQRAIDVVLGHKVGRVVGHIRARHYAKRFNVDRVRRLVAYVWSRAFSPALQTPATEPQSSAPASAPPGAASAGPDSGSTPTDG